MFLPEGFGDTVHRVFGERGRVWLSGLPGIVARCRDKWGLGTGVVCPALSMNYIEFTTTALGSAVVLKVGVPHAELLSEMEALRLYGGRGAVELLDTDPELGAILMRRVRPGIMLRELGNNAAETRVAAAVMRDLHRPVPPAHSLPAFADWVERAFRLTRTEWDPQELMPRDLIDRAEEAFRYIEHAAGPASVVLHGDLHHENILFDDDAGWIAIDPKGVIGPPCLEVGRFLQNQLPTQVTPGHRAALVHERLDILSHELGYSHGLLAASGLVDCVLSHCWCFEEEALGPDWCLGVELARMLCGIMDTQPR